MFKSIQEVQTLLASTPSNAFIVFDIETAVSGRLGKGVYDTPIICSLYNKDWEDAICIVFSESGITHPNTIPAGMVLYLLKDRRLIGQNLQYDLQFLSANYQRLLGERFVPTHPWVDTLLLARLTFPEWRERSKTPYTLDKIASRIFSRLNRRNPYDGMDKKVMQTSFKVGVTPTEQMIEYAKTDVLILPTLAGYMRDAYRSDSYKTQIEAHRATFEFRGMLYSPKKADVIFNSLRKSIKPYHVEGQSPNTKESKELRADVIASMVNEEEDALHSKYCINVKSPSDKKAVLGIQYSADEYILKVIAYRPDGLEGLEYRPFQFKKWLHDKTKGKVTLFERGSKTEKAVETFGNLLWTYFNMSYTDYLQYGLPETPITYLVEPYYIHSEYKQKLAVLLLEQMKKRTMLSFDDRLKEKTINNRLEANWLQSIAVTTRLNSGKFKNSLLAGKGDNISQFPRSLKDIWVAPTGRKLVYGDYSQIELRTLVALMGDSTLARAMLDGEDTHLATTRMIEEMLPTHVLEALRRRGIKPRQIGKKFNFSLLYKSGAGMLQEAILMDMNVWLELSLLEELKRAWFKLYPDIADWHDEVLSRGKTVTMLGRRYSYTKSSPFNTRFNYVNQASGAEVSQSAIPDIVAMCREFNNAYVVNFQHDSYIIECDEADAITIATKFKQIAELAQHEVLCRGYYPEIQLPFEVVIGDCWGEMEKGINCQTI